jgi:hypothetical protein
MRAFEIALLNGYIVDFLPVHHRTFLPVLLPIVRHPAAHHIEPKAD